jgi:hypothetical protein
LPSDILLGGSLGRQVLDQEGDHTRKYEEASQAGGTEADAVMQDLHFKTFIWSVWQIAQVG